eukprot:446113_1
MCQLITINHQESHLRKEVNVSQLLYNVNIQSCPTPIKNESQPTMNKKETKTKTNESQSIRNQKYMLKLIKSNGGISGAESEVISVVERTLAFESRVKLEVSMFELLTIAGGKSTAGGKSIVSNTICGALSNDEG